MQTIIQRMDQQQGPTLEHTAHILNALHAGSGVKKLLTRQTTQEAQV